MKKLLLLFLPFVFFEFLVSASSSLKITSVRARLLPATIKNTAVYADIENKTFDDIKIVSANFPIAKSTELHTIEKKNDVIKMIRIKAFTVGARTRKSLMPGGIHIMLIGLRRRLKEGEKLQGILTTDKGEKIFVEAVVKKSFGMKHKKNKNIKIQ